MKGQPDANQPVIAPHALLYSAAEDQFDIEFVTEY